MNLKDLSKEIPFKWRVQSTKYGKTTCVAYIDARDCMDLLDEVSKQLGNVREDAAGNKTNVTGTIASDVQEMQYLTKRGNI